MILDENLIRAYACWVFEVSLKPTPVQTQRKASSCRHALHANTRSARRDPREDGKLIPRSRFPYTSTLEFGHLRHLARYRRHMDAIPLSAEALFIRWLKVDKVCALLISRSPPLIRMSVSYGGHESCVRIIPRTANATQNAIVREQMQ